MVYDDSTGKLDWENVVRLIFLQNQRSSLPNKAHVSASGDFQQAWFKVVRGRTEVPWETVELYSWIPTSA